MNNAWFYIQQLYWVSIEHSYEEIFYAQFD